MPLPRLFRAKTGGNYAYVTARVRAKKSFLLPRETWPKLLARDLPEIARTLQEGQYKDEVDALAGRARGAELIERATRANLGRTYASILSWSEGELAVMIGLYLARYDVYNLKTILRGKFAKVSADEILTELVPAGADYERLAKLARVDTMDEVFQGLAGSNWAKPVDEALGGRRDVRSLFEVENALDRAYYALLLEGVAPDNRPKEAFRKFLEREIDVVNLKTVFRLRAESVADLEPYWVAGGERIEYETGVRLLKARPDEVLAELGQLPWWKDIEAGVRATLETGALNPVATALERGHMASADDFSHRYPLSVLPVIDFILSKKIEADNLRIIATGKETGLKESVIEELIIA